MTYDPNSPLPTFAPKDSVVQIKTNFNQFAGIFSALSGGVNYNHMPLNDSNQGLHGAVIFQNQSVDPDVTEDQVDLYSKNVTSAVSTEPQLFSKIQKFLPNKYDTTTAENTPIQLTYDTVNIAGPTAFQSFLPGGYLLYFGSVVTFTPPNSITTVTLTPVCTEIVCVQAFPTSTISSEAAKRYVTITGANTFNIVSSNALNGTTFVYMVVAKQ